MNAKPLFLTIAAALGLVFLTPKAHADAPQRLGIISFQSVEPNLQRRDLDSLSRKLLFQFDSNDKYKVVRKWPLTGGRKPIKRNKNLAAEKKRELAGINKQLSRAAQKMMANDFEKAIPILKGGLVKAAKLMRWPESFPIVARICGLWALAAFRMGRGEEGELLLKVLARLNPKPPPSEIKANPQMRYRYKRALRATLKSPKGSIKVIGTEGATVYIDGQKRGTIPHEVTNLPKGLHYIRVTYSGYEPWGRALNVKANVPTTAKAYLKALPQKKPDGIVKQRIEMITNIQSLSLGNSTFSSAAQALCLRANLKHLFTANLKAKGSNYILTPIHVNCRTQAIKKGAEIPVNSSFIDVELSIYQGMIKLLRKPQGRTTPRRIAVVRRIPPIGGTTPPKGTPVYKKWWFWTLITLTAAGGAAAATTYYFVSQPPKLGVSATWTLK